MKHLITLGVIITVFSSTFIGLPNLIAESRGALDSYHVAVRKDLGKPNKQENATSILKFNTSLKRELTNSTNKSLRYKSNQNHRNSFGSGPSKLNHRKLMSALVTLSILARGN